MVDFLYGTNWRRFVEEKCMKMTKSSISGQKPVGGTGTMMQWASGTGTTQTGTCTHWQRGTCTGTSHSGTGTTASNSPVFSYFCTVKLCIHIPIV